MNEHFISVGKFTWSLIGVICSSMVVVFAGFGLERYLIGDSLEGQMTTVLTNLVVIGFIAAVTIPFGMTALLYFSPKGPTIGIGVCLDWMVSAIGQGLLQWVIGAVLVSVIEYTVSPGAGMVVFVTYYYATSMFVRFSAADLPTKID